ncbi:MAG: DinB family protein [Vicinamibacterales bacterium]
MDAQIEGYLLQLTSITQDLPGIAARLSDDQFNWRQSPERWSIGQCIEHLNITLERYLPVLRSTIADARSAGRVGTGPFTLGLIERWFLSSLEPPARMRLKAPKSFIASPQLSPQTTLDRWDRLHAELAAVIRDAEGLDLRAIKVRSQFGPVSFSFFATLAILLAHERRHAPAGADGQGRRWLPCNMTA